MPRLSLRVPSSSSCCCSLSWP